ncbi:hypothetical protein Tco_1078409 [Tanacetum coccineum]|uniref:BZIP domain-containing protein n=1 Tax=Tanacetum coccineum TaxID=301880 RepID=A0ABQ5HQ79_9ASTR
MGRDTIQLEDAVSTISGEYLLEFTSEYGIPEGLHPELPGPEDTIVDFPEGKVEMDLFNLINSPNPAKVKTGTRPHAAYEVPLLTATASRVIEIEDPVATSTSSETSSVMEKSPLDFVSEDLPPMITNKGETEDQAPAVASQEVPSTENTATAEFVLELKLEKETTAKEPPVNKRRRKRDQSAVEGNAPPKVLRKDHASIHPAQDTCGGKSLAAIRSSKIAAVVADPDSENTSFTSMARSLGSIYQPRWGVTNGCHLDTSGACQQVAMGSQLRLRFEREAKLLKKYVAQVARRDQRIQARENKIKNLEALLEAEADMKKAAEAKNAEIVKELESLRAQFTDL